MVTPEDVTATVKIEVSYELALVMKGLIKMGIDGSGHALEAIPSVEAKMRLVRRREELFDLDDIVKTAMYQAQLEMET